MPMKNWAALRFRALGGDEPNGDAEPQFLEVTDLEGLPVKVVNPTALAQGYSFVSILGDTLIKSGPGLVHTITLCSDAAATAGTFILYDNNAESGTVIAKVTFVAAYFPPVTLTLDAAFSTGLYAGFTTTADVDVTVTYR